MGGAGVVVDPALISEALPVGQLGALDFAHQRHNSETQLWTPLKGQVATSGRAECLALSVALRFPCPVHIVPDSQLVANRYQAWQRKGVLPDPEQPPPLAETPGGPVQTLAPAFVGMPDGDMWQQVAMTMCKRGPLSANISKIKSHLTLEQALDRGFSAHDWQGNCCC